MKLTLVEDQVDQIPNFIMNMDMNPSRFHQKQKGVGRIARFLHGKRPAGQPVWQGVHGNPVNAQGFLYGTMGKNEKISGKKSAYIYPSARLALVGHFKDNYMKSAQKAYITKATCQDNFITLEFSEPEGPAFHFDVGTNTSMGGMPLVVDPYQAIFLRGLTTFSYTMLLWLTK